MFILILKTVHLKEIHIVSTQLETFVLNRKLIPVKPECDAEANTYPMSFKLYIRMSQWLIARKVYISCVRSNIKHNFKHRPYCKSIKIKIIDYQIKIIKCSSECSKG